MSFSVATAATPRPARRASRWRAGVLTTAAAMVVSACGGGVEIGHGDFFVDIVVGGLFVSDTRIAPGGSTSLAIRAGQSIKLDARESAYWTLYVGGAAVPSGVPVYFAGLDVTATAISASAVNVTTFSVFGLRAPVPITLVATSTFDAAQVATVHILVTN